MNLELLAPAVRNYLLEHISTNTAQFALQKHPFKQLSTQALTQQLIGLQKARVKLPDFFENTQIVYPPKVNLEQTSSMSTAQYKARLTPGNSMIDITGGFGVDVSAFAKAYSQTTHVELNPLLQELATQLFVAQGLKTKSYCANGIEFLNKNDTYYDLIYLDPSRKTAASAKAVQLEDYEPQVVENLALLFSKAPVIMLKTSPMLDITAGLLSLKQVSALHVIAVKNEVKELLWILKKNVDNPTITAINLESDQPVFTAYLQQSTASINYGAATTYLYEPNAAVMKTQCFGAICEQYFVVKLDRDAHLFTSDALLDFPGRAFKINAIHDYKPKIIKRKYSKSARAVVTRNFRESVAQLRTKYKLTESEDHYLFFTSIEGKYVVIEALKV